MSSGPGAPCPECGRPTETVKEENYFFKLSAFQDKLLELYTEQPDFIRPETRRNEVMSFVRVGPARSLDQPQHVLLGHSGPGRSQARDLRLARRAGQLHHRARLRIGRHEAKYDKFWPADVQMIGKEIVRFHCVYWPAFLMAAGLAAAARDRGARLAAVRRKQDVEVARQHRAQRRPFSTCWARTRCAISCCAKSSSDRMARFQLRRAGAALQRRSGQRPGQSGQPHADHDHALLRGRSAVSLARRDSHRRRECDRRNCEPNHRGIQRAVRSIPVFARARSRVGPGRLRSTSTSSRTSPGRWARSRTTKAARAWRPFSTPALRRCAS